MKNKNIIIVSIIVILAIFFGASYFYKKSLTNKSLTLSKTQTSLFQRPYSFVVGNNNAKVQLVEFFDPACATCASFHPYVKKILKKYDGKVKLVLRYAPFHKNSFYAVKMLEGAREQEKFMQMLEFMFDTQKQWTQHHEVKADILWDMLANIDGLDMDTLAKFMNEPKNDYAIKQDLEDAKALGITKTPGYIVNGKPLQEFGLDNLIKLIESQIEE